MRLSSPARPSRNIKLLRSALKQPGNAIIAFIPPAGKRWKIHALNIWLTTSATIANRYIDVMFYIQTALGTEGVCFENAQASAQVANTSRWYLYCPTPQIGEISNPNGYGFLLEYIPPTIEMDQAGSVNVRVTNGQADDAISIYVLGSEENYRP